MNVRSKKNMIARILSMVMTVVMVITMAPNLGRVHKVRAAIKINLATSYLASYEEPEMPLVSDSSEEEKKTEAKQEIDTVRSALSDTDYYAEDILSLDKIVDDTKAAIDAAKTTDAVDTEKQKGLDALAAVKKKSGVHVAYRTQDEIRSYIKQCGATVNDALFFAEQPGVTAPYSLGRLSDVTLTSANKMLNQIRYIAGVSSNVTLDESMSEKAQASSLANYVNQRMAHHPERPNGMSDAMYSLATEGGSASNIAWYSAGGYGLNEALAMWMADDDDSNIATVVHRRWILNPSMEKTGFGAVSGINGTYSAMYAHDESNTSAAETGVVWPAQNMPTTYFGKNHPWSISMGKELNDENIQVTLTRKSDGKTWNFSKTSADGYFNVENTYYGQRGCIIFRPNRGISSYKAGDTYTVIVTGLPTEDIYYTVKFFDLISSPSSNNNENIPTTGSSNNNENIPATGGGGGGAATGSTSTSSDDKKTDTIGSISTKPVRKNTVLQDNRNGCKVKVVSASKKNPTVSFVKSIRK